jgi:hypothetical protein
MMSFPAAAAEWERLREERDAGGDPALSKRQARGAEREARATAKKEQEDRGYTVRRLCEDYLAGHVDPSRSRFRRLSITTSLRECSDHWQTVVKIVGDLLAEFDS